MEVKLSRGAVAFISDCDADLILSHKWHCLAIGYAARSVRKKKKRSMVYMHREITKAKPGELVDHINGNTLDNRRENLRIVTKSENNRNRIKPTRASSGYFGVVKTKEGRWKSFSRSNGKFLHIGHYDTPEEAANARDEYLDSIGDIFSKRNNAPA